MTSQSAGLARDPHAGHDRETLAAYAAGDASADVRARAESQVHGCDACATLVSDLRAIAAATRHLPPPLVISRDYRLSADDAHRLRGGPVRRILRSLGLPAWNPRPLAAALMTVGFAGLIISALPLMPFGSGGARLEAAAASGEKAIYGAAGGDTAASPRASVGVPGGPVVPGPVYASAARSFAARDSMVPEDLVVTPAPTDATAAPPRAAPRSEAPGSSVVLLSLGFIGAGGALFVLGRRPRRSR